MDWTSDQNATYLNQSCEQWGQQNDEIDLISCEQTFGDITDYKDIK